MLENTESVSFTTCINGAIQEQYALKFVRHNGFRLLEKPRMYLL